MHQLQNLGLNGHVQSGGRLVGNQDVRLAGQGHGDHDPLTHTAGELVGVLLHPFFRLVDVDQPQHFHGPLPGLLFVAARVQQNRFHQLVADGVGGVQGGHGILKNNGDPVAPNLLHAVLADTHQLLPVELYGAGDNFAGFFQNLQDGVGGDGLAGAGFPHNAQHLAPLQLKGHAVHRFYFTGRGIEGGVQVINFEKCHVFALLSQDFNFGSNASRRPSPNRFRDRTISEMVSAGMTMR